MFTLLVVLHIFISVVLVAAVLLQSGRGAATANIFGGSRAAENVFGASTPAIMNKVTGALATAFIITSVALTLLSGEMRRSVVQRAARRQPPVAGETLPALPAEEAVSVEVVPDGGEPPPDDDGAASP